MRAKGFLEFLNESQEPGTVESYRELYGLGMISLEDYYRDLEEAGYSIEQTYIDGEPKLRIKCNDSNLKEQIASKVRSFEGWRDERIVDFSIDILGQHYQSVRANLSTGDSLEYRFDTVWNKMRLARINGRDLSQEDIMALNSTIAQSIKRTSSTFEYGVSRMTQLSILSAALTWLVHQLGPSEEE